MPVLAVGSRNVLGEVAEQKIALAAKYRAPVQQLIY
jgi:hypothetical protein